MDSRKPENINVDKLSQSIDQMQKQMRQRYDEIEKKEAYFEKRRLPLPDRLYHVTTRKNVKQIMREGLDPSKLIFEDRDVVGLSDDIDFAIEVAEETQNTTRGNLVVLEVDTQYLTPSRIHNYLRRADLDNPNFVEAAAIHEVHYESSILPDAIKIINKDK